MTDPQPTPLERLELFQLETSSRTMLMFSANTRRVYARQVARFARFCAAEGLNPYAPQVAADYLAAMGGELGSQSVQQATAAIRHAWRRADVYDRAVWDAAIVPVVRATLRQLAERGDATRQAIPLRLDDLKAACRALYQQSQRLDGARAAHDLALVTLGWFGGYRGAELRAMRQSDIADDDRGLTVRLRVSKTTDAPVTTYIPRGRAVDTCPLLAWRRWSERRHRTLEFDDEAPAFVAWRGGVQGAEAMGVNATGAALHRALMAAGWSATDARAYTSHSLRAGLATELAEHGAPMQAIANACRWQRLETVLGYARRARGFTDAPHHRLAY